MVKPFVLEDKGNPDLEDDMRKDDFHYHRWIFIFYDNNSFIGEEECVGHSFEYVADFLVLKRGW